MTDEDQPSREEQLLIDVLWHRNVPCPHCGYNLRDLTSSRCPECGAAVTINRLLARPTPSILPWGIALLATALGATESFTKWRELIGTGSIFYGSVEPPPLRAMFITSLWRYASHAYWLAQFPLLPLLLIARRRFQRLPVWMQWTAASAFLLATLVAHRRLFGLWLYF